MDFPCGSAGKESACNVGGLGLIPGLESSPGEGKGYPQSMGVTKSWTRLGDLHWYILGSYCITGGPKKMLALNHETSQ